MRHHQLQHRFVERVPRQLEAGVLYVSMEHGTAIHSCCCGCGEEVVTPLTPTDWKMTYDGESVSLHPSVGNWQLACRSHYVIDHGRVIEAGRWTRKQIADEQERDRRVKARYYSTEEAASIEPVSSAATPDSPPTKHPRIWAWLKELFR